MLSTAYLGPVSYFAAISNANNIYIEAEEHYIKQTWRNRCRIMTANGPLNLTIPVIKVHGNHTKVKDIAIDYSENWQKIHWRAIMSAYQHSPYFQYYKDELTFFYTNKISHLLDFNLQLTKTIFTLVGINKDLYLSQTYQKVLSVDLLDFRNTFSPKKNNQMKFPPYIHVFRERHGFVPNLSILDLLLNMGPDTKSYLEKIRPGEDV